MRRVYHSVLLLLLFLLLAPTLAVFTPKAVGMTLYPAGDWVEIAANPGVGATGGGQGDAGTAQYNGKMYMIGGWTKGDQSDIVANVSIYDPATDSWSQGTPIPTPVKRFPCSELDGLIYCVAGQNGAGAQTKGVQVYNETSDSWSTTTDFPYDDQAGSMVADPDNHALYYMGGQDYALKNGPLYVFTTSNSTWRYLTNVTSNDKSIMWATMAYQSGVIYILAGNSMDGYGYAYTISNGTVNQLAREDGAAVGGNYPWACDQNPGIIKGLVPLIAGYANGLQMYTWFYNISANTYTEGPNILKGQRDAPSVEVIGDTIYMAGGYTQTDAEKLTPLFANTGYVTSDSSTVGPLSPMSITANETYNLVADSPIWGDSGLVFSTLPGATTWLRYTPPSSENFTQMSWFAWVYVTAGSSTSTEEVLFSNELGDPIWVSLYHNPNVLNIYLGTTNNKGYHTSSDSVPTGSWQFVGFTYNSTYVQPYVAGAASGGDSDTGTITLTSNPWYFGTANNNRASLNGTLGPVYMFDRAINSTEVSWLYNGGAFATGGKAPLNFTGLVGWWRMDEGSGTVVYGYDTETIYTSQTLLSTPISETASGVNSSIIYGLNYNFSSSVWPYDNGTWTWSLAPGNVSAFRVNASLACLYLTGAEDGRTYHHIVFAAGSGIISLNRTTGDYPEGATVTVSAKVSANYHFTNATFGNGTVLTTNPFTFTVTQNDTIKAYGSNQWYITFATGGGGSMNGTTGWQTNGTSYEVEATPSSNHDFLNWVDSINGNSTHNPYTFTVTGNATITAYFVQTYHVIFATVGSGSVNQTTGDWADGSVVNVLAIPGDGHSFSHFGLSNGTTYISNPLALDVGSNLTVTANFQPTSTTTPGGGGRGEIPAAYYVTLIWLILTMASVWVIRAKRQPATALLRNALVIGIQIVAMILAFISGLSAMTGGDELMILMAGVNLVILIYAFGRMIRTR